VNGGATTESCGADIGKAAGPFTGPAVRLPAARRQGNQVWGCGSGGEVEAAWERGPVPSVVSFRSLFFGGFSRPLELGLRLAASSFGNHIEVLLVPLRVDPFHLVDGLDGEEIPDRLQ
jgi:hypothetical protein